MGEGGVLKSNRFDPFVWKSGGDGGIDGWEYSEKFVGFKSDFRANFLILSSKRGSRHNRRGGVENFTEWKRHCGRLCVNSVSNILCSKYRII